MNDEPFFRAVMPLSPTVNGSYQRVSYETRDDDVVNTLGATKELRQFKRNAEKALMAQRPQQDWRLINDIIVKKQKRKQVPLIATVTFYLKSLWISDVDGRLKASLDAACKYIGINDNLIVRIILSKELDKLNPRCEISISLKDSDNYVFEKEAKITKLPVRKRSTTKPQGIATEKRRVAKVAKKNDRDVEKALRTMRKRGETLAKTTRFIG